MTKNRKHVVFFSVIIGLFLAFMVCTSAIASWQDKGPERQIESLQEQKTEQLITLREYREDMDAAKQVLEDARSVLQSAQEAFDSAQAMVEAQRAKITRTEREIQSLVDVPLASDSSSR